MKNQNRNHLIIGVIILVLVVMFLTLPLAPFLSSMSTLGTSINTYSTNEVSVRTKEDFGNQEVVANFPKIIGQWEGQDYPVAEYLQDLEADAMLVRVYEPSSFSQPIYFTIVQSKSDSSFHNPITCFTDQGYQIQEQGQESAAINSTALVGTSDIIVPLNKLVVTQMDTDGNLTQRRLVLYFYVKSNPYYSDTITMVQLDALVPLQGSYDSTLNEEKDFLNQVMPLMFSTVKANSAYHPLLLTFVDWGVGGYAIILVLLLIPAGIILLSRITKANVKERKENFLKT